MSRKAMLHQTVDPDLIMDLLSKAGIRRGEEVFITVEPGQLSVRKDPIAELWGSLANPKEKSPRELIDEATESESGLLDDSEA